MNSKLFIASDEWFGSKGWQPHAFQRATWKAVEQGNSGLLNAPTGSGKTYAMWFGILQNLLEEPSSGELLMVWITPLRALAREIQHALQQTCDDLGLAIKVGSRTGDTEKQEKDRQKRSMPHVLITTPESLHLMIAQKGYTKVLGKLRYFVADEWHELMGSKRGVQVELALSRLRTLNPQLCIWGISATIGNMDEALTVLLGDNPPPFQVVKADIEKQIEVVTLIPEEVETYPWAGHLGIKMAPALLEVIKNNRSTLVFTNTRSQAEIWYQRLLEMAPWLAGSLAMHHGSVSHEIRQWVEDSLHQGRLQAVICTSSLDLGVDFRPVDAVVQIGSPKGVARFIQRAGRSGHRPGAVSNIYFLPTNSLEIMEGAALREAIKTGSLEERIPFIRSFDVLVQYLVTLAISEGFRAEEIYQEIKGTHCFSSIGDEEWHWVLNFISKGGQGLQSYEDFHKVVIEDRVFKVTSKRIAMRHRLSIGTIVSDTMMQVKFMSGKRLGSIEEWFISSLNTGDTFYFGGKNLELVRIKDLEAYVKKSKSNKGKIPSWQGGRMPLSSQLSKMYRLKLEEYIANRHQELEVETLRPLLEQQKAISHLPDRDELLIEQIESKEGYHIFIYPYEGRGVHEGMAAVVAARLAAKQAKGASFSIAMNDHGFELLSDQYFDMEKAMAEGIFNTKDLGREAMNCVNATEMAARRFRDIATISGLVFQGFPGKLIRTKHLQASSQLFFKVFQEYDPHNLLLRQAYDEVADLQLSLSRLYDTFERMNIQKIIVRKPDHMTPFSFPIMAERFREKFSNEDLATRLEKVKQTFQKKEQDKKTKVKRKTTNN